MNNIKPISKEEFLKSKDMQNMDRCKFRIFNKTKQKMQYLCTKPRCIENEFYMQIDCTGISCIDEDGLITDFDLIYPTGLKDKNGKLIYEGDIIKWYNNIYQTEYQQNICSFRVVSKDNLMLDLDLAITCEIIGNIFENPELVKN